MATFIISDQQAINFPLDEIFFFTCYDPSVIDNFDNFLPFVALGNF